MRRLLYVPIIHTDADAGQLAEGLEERAKGVVGDSNWQRHKEVVRRYWQEIANYWDGKEVAGWKIFQDGMPVGGAVGETTVKELADKGSINHQIVARLLEKGAQLMQTEDAELLKEEYFLIRDLLEKKSLPGSFSAVFRYKQRKDGLLRARDHAIVKRIDAGLAEGETGVCFLGAYHQVWSSLPKDIAVITMKDPAKVRAYHQKFTSNRGGNDVDRLEAYLTSPINRQAGENDE
jgi:hypothetical protein